MSALRPIMRKRSATAKALPLASNTSVSSVLVWRSAHCSNCSNSTRVEVLNTCALAGSVPSTTAPAKLSGCTSSPTTRPLFLIMILLLLRLVVMLHYLDARRGRLLTNSRYTQTSGAEPPTLVDSLHEGSSVRLTQPSIGEVPTAAPESCRVPLALVLFASPIARYQNVRSRLASSPQNHIPSANPAIALWLQSTPLVGRVAELESLDVVSMLGVIRRWPFAAGMFAVHALVVLLLYF